MSPSESADMRFMQLGVQYYIAARSTAVAQQIPVCGNLFHHAVEMVLKARLAQNLSLRDLAKIGHALPALWETFKSEFPTTSLVEFDAVISEITPFERLRYPNNMIVEGAAISLAWERSEVGAADPGAAAIPNYNIVVADIDRLVAKVFEVCSRNPNFFFPASLPEYARYAITWRNPVGEYLLTGKRG